MDKLKPTDSISASDSGIADCSLLEEINRQAAVILNSPAVARKLLADLEDPSPKEEISTTSESKTTSSSYSKAYGSFDLILTNSTETTNNTSSSSSSPKQAASEPPRSPQSPSESSTVFTENHAPNSSHIGILLLSNARRKLQLEEERIEFEKEKLREKEKRKSKKLFYRLSKRVREKGGMGVDTIPQSLSDSALKRIDENDIDNGQQHSSGTYFKQHRNTSTDSGLIPSSADDREETLEEKCKRLEQELKESRQNENQLHSQCLKYKNLQKAMDNEVQDLTETLFQQAYRVADSAELKRQQAEKLLAESLLKVDLLQAEVKALKDIVKSPAKRGGLKDRFGHKNSPVYFLSPKSKGSSLQLSPMMKASKSATSMEPPEIEVDPIYFSEFKEWLSSSISLSDDNPESSQFLQRIIKEDVQPCLTFSNVQLASDILDAIKKNTLEMESYFDESIKKCDLTHKEKVCSYKIKTDANDKEWSYISFQARNRITAVCDLFTYLRYLRNGIVKSLPHDSYLEIASMRKNMALARFGFEFVTKMNGTGLTTSAATDDNN